ncbi:MAG: carboxypeptidase-like regulatory domain-containing protein [Planctomycetota bacterium]|nr:carboxypeptidase-like regulatory domain-containing protein [Planctomycetota bacterium]
MRRLVPVLLIALVLALSLWLASHEPPADHLDVQEPTEPQQVEPTLSGSGMQPGPPRPAGGLPPLEDAAAAPEAGRPPPEEPGAPAIPARIGILFSAGRSKPRPLLESMFSSEWVKDLGPAVGYPVRIRVGPGDRWLEGTTDAQGQCRLGPFPLGSLRAGDRRHGNLLTIRGGGGDWAITQMDFDLDFILANASTPQPDVPGDAPVAWVPVGWSDWKGVPVSGRVIDAAGRPLADVRVFDGTYGVGRRTDRAGRFSLRCPPGEIALFVDSFSKSLRIPAKGPGFRSIELHRSVLPAHGVEGLTLRVPAGHSLRARVLLADGQPAPHDVDVHVQHLRAQKQEVVATWSGDVLELVGLVPGERYALALRAGHPFGNMPLGTPIEATPGTTIIDLRIAKRLLRVGLVDATTGEPIAGTTEILGTGREPGTELRVKGWAWGYSPAEQVYVMEDAPAEQVAELRLHAVPRGGALRVRCLGPGGKVVREVPLQVSFAGMALAPHWEERDGYAVTQGLGPGSYRIGFDSPSASRSTYSSKPRLGVPGTGTGRYLLGVTRTIEIPLSTFVLRSEAHSSSTSRSRIARSKARSCTNRRSPAHRARTSPTTASVVATGPTTSTWPRNRA